MNNIDCYRRNGINYAASKESVKLMCLKQEEMGKHKNLSGIDKDQIIKARHQNIFNTAGLETK